MNCLCHFFIITFHIFKDSNEWKTLLRQIIDDGCQVIDDGRQIIDDGRQVIDDGRQVIDDGCRFGSCLADMEAAIPDFFSHSVLTGIDF